MKIIQLTDEQAEALASGEDILIKAPEKKKWEPKHGEFYRASSGGNFSTTQVDVKVVRILKDRGFLRSKQREVEKLDKRIVSLARLDAWVTEHGGHKEFIEGSNNFYVSYNKYRSEYVITNNTVYGGVNTIYMTRECVELTVEALNSGELTL